jgi:hypothetical protein
MFNKNFGNITIWAVMCIILLISSCGGCNKTSNNQPRPAIEAAKYPIKLERFEQELFNLDTTKLQYELVKLRQKYGVFYTSFANDIMRMPANHKDTLFINPMRMLLSIARLHELQQIVDSNFKNMSDVEEELSIAMGIYHKEFPKAVDPLNFGI